MGRQPMTRMDDDVERPTPRGDTDTLDNNAKTGKGYWIALPILSCIAKTGKRYCIALPIILFCIAIAACLMVVVGYYGVDAHYSVAIDSVSDVLDPKTGVLFNLTLSVASRSHAAMACIHPGMFVEVFYRGVPVAASDAAAETRPTCAMARNVTEIPVMARETRMLVGGVLDNLAAEMGQGAAVFDLRLHDPYATRWHGGRSWSAWFVWDCKGSHIGDAAVPCDSPTYTEVLN